MKHSSIEWIYNNLKSHFEHDGDLLEAVNMSFEQAKAMHKEKLLDTWEDSRIEYMGDDYIGKTKSFDDYYNETFNTKEK